MVMMMMQAMMLWPQPRSASLQGWSQPCSALAPPLWPRGPCCPTCITQWTWKEKRGRWVMEAQGQGPERDRIIDFII
eukprot:1488332-Karenia_brevis.AAC.1